MNRNFIRLASANIDLNLLNVKKNKENIKNYIEYANKLSVDLLQFSELTLTGLSAGDITVNKGILEESKHALLEIKKFTRNMNLIVSVGLPLNINGEIYNVLAILNNGNILAFIPKLSNYCYARHMSDYQGDIEFFFDDKIHKLSNNFVFSDKNHNFKIGFEFEDDFMHRPAKYIEKDVSILSIAGSSPEFIGNPILDFLSKYSIGNKAVNYAGPSSRESSTNEMYSARRIILENGELLENISNYKNGISYTDINLYNIGKQNYIKSFIVKYVDLNESDCIIKRNIDPSPFIPKIHSDYAHVMQNILNIQSEALKRRLSALKDKKVFIGISGGLDSTLALIVTSLTYFKMGLDSKNIQAVLMPGFGTSTRTLMNGRNLAQSYNATISEIDISASVTQHFKDIEHDPNDLSIVYENSQARERTQILMDLANKHGGIVLGTGNMSEIALGWATYNGDHMSMYAINSGLPKTLLREVVRFVANSTNNALLKDTLNDILETPISPELLPTKNDEIVQKTEENVGPYELHDFFIYHFIRNLANKDDVLFMAKLAFKDKYSHEEIEKWLNKFLFRFKTQQFKRNCMPDGPKILDFSLNPRNGLIMASDIDIDAF